MKPIETAAFAACGYGDKEGPCKTLCGICKGATRAAVLAYLKALVTEGPSPFMIERIDRIAEDPEYHWETMLKAHIAELEAGK